MDEITLFTTIQPPPPADTEAIRQAARARLAVTMCRPQRPARHCRRRLVLSGVAAAGVALAVTGRHRHFQTEENLRSHPAGARASGSRSACDRTVGRELPGAAPHRGGSGKEGRFGVEVCGRSSRQAAMGGQTATPELGVHHYSLGDAQGGETRDQCWAFAGKRSRQPSIHGPMD